MVWCEELPAPLLLPLEGRDGLCWGPAHTCVAAFAAAGGGRVRNVVFAILPLCGGLSFRNVLNMPPLFLSGLGVLSRGRPATGGTKLVEELLFCRLLVRGTSPELFLLTYDGRGGGVGRICVIGCGRGMSAYVAWGTVSLPSQEVEEVRLSGAGCCVDASDSLLLEGALPFAFASSSASSRLFLRASSKSTRSLHWSSIARKESHKAFSVSLRGDQLEGIL